MLLQLFLFILELVLLEDFMCRPMFLLAAAIRETVTDREAAAIRAAVMVREADAMDAAV